MKINKIILAGIMSLALAGCSSSNQQEIDPIDLLDTANETTAASDISETTTSSDISETTTVSETISETTTTEETTTFKSAEIQIENSVFDLKAIGADNDTSDQSNLKIYYADGSVFYEDLDGDGNEEELKLVTEDWIEDFGAGPITYSDCLVLYINGSPKILVGNNDIDCGRLLEEKVFAAIGIGDIDSTDPYKEIIYCSPTYRDFNNFIVARYEKGYMPDSEDPTRYNGNEDIRELFSFDSLSIGAADSYPEHMPIVMNGSGNILVRGRIMKTFSENLLWLEYSYEDILENSFFRSDPADGIYYTVPYEFIDNYSALADYDTEWSRICSSDEPIKRYDHFSSDLSWLKKGIDSEMNVYSECSADSERKTIAPQNVYITALKMTDGEVTWNYIAGEDGTCGWIPADVSLEFVS